MPIPAMATGRDRSFTGLQIIGIETNMVSMGSADSDVLTTLHSYPVPANSFQNTGDGFVFRYAGTLANPAGSTSQVTLTLGGLSVFDSGLFKPTTGGGWVLEGVFVRATDGTLLGYYSFTSGELKLASNISTGPDLTVDNALVLSGQGHTVNDVTKVAAVIDYRGQ